MKNFLLKSVFIRIVLLFLLALTSQIIYDATLLLFFYYAFFVFLFAGFTAIIILTIKAFINQYKEYKATKKK